MQAVFVLGLAIIVVVVVAVVIATRKKEGFWHGPRWRPWGWRGRWYYYDNPGRTYRGTCEQDCYYEQNCAEKCVNPKAEECLRCQADCFESCR